MRGRAFVICIAAAALISCERPEKKVQGRDLTGFHDTYQQNCSGCHGDDGKGGPGRQLNDAVYLALLPKDKLRETIENGRPGTAMPAFAQAQGGPMSPDQVTALVEGIERNWAKPVNFNGITPPPYSVDGEAGNVDHGKELFGRNCVMCHGPKSKVGPVTDVQYLALVSNQWLRSSIIAGRKDLGMPDWRMLNRGKPLSDGDVADLVAYLVSLRLGSKPGGTS